MTDIMKAPHIEWAICTLNDSGYYIETIKPELILNTAWSQVCRFQTKLGLIYLKKVPSALFLEANVIELLRKKFDAPVPHLLGQNQNQHCFLMQDAGIPLHDFFKQKYNADILIEAIYHYTMLQFNISDKTNLFLDLGVPDWRLNRLPQLYRELITQEELLLADGLMHNEINKLKKLNIVLVEICEELANFSIPETLSHCDFHEKNILINTDTLQTTIIDLGEVAISHPFFSLNNCLHMVYERFGLTDAHYRQLQKTCLQPWLHFESEANLWEILSLIQKVWSIHAVLGEYRLLQSVDTSIFPLLQREGGV